MRATAEIDEAAAAVDGNVRALGQFADPLGLIGFTAGSEHGGGFGAVPDFAHDRFVPRDDGAHLGFDRGQVFLGEGAGGGGEVVVEAVFGRGAEGDLRAGVEFLDGFGEHMRVIVPGEFERVRLVARGHQRELRAIVQGAGEIADFAVHARGERRLGEAGADGGGHVGGGRSGGHGAHRTVGERHVDGVGGRSVVEHGCAPMAAPRGPQARVGYSTVTDFARLRG